MKSVRGPRVGQHCCNGWQEEDGIGNLLPIWALLPLCRDIFHMDVKCTCTSTCSLCKRMQSKIEVYPSMYFSERPVWGFEPPRFICYVIVSLSDSNCSKEPYLQIGPGVQAFSFHLN